jgi:hypothetical protein
MADEPWRGTLGLLEKLGAPGPITRERFLNLYYAGQPPARLTAEEEAQLPPQFRQEPVTRAAKLED